MRDTRILLGLTLAVALAGAGCSRAGEEIHTPVPAVSIADGATKDDPKTLTLTPQAVTRLDVTTVVVEDPARVPYSAVIYDKKGAPWVYTNPQEQTYIRVPVTVTRIEGDDALISSGPAGGTRVVARAAIKLYGAETGVGGGH